VKVRLSEAARSDLNEIGDWIARDSRRRAESFVAELIGRCRSLSTLPRAHPEVLTVRSRSVRRLTHGNYLVFYEIDEQAREVLVLRVLHGARDYEALFRRSEDSE
jgi:plasmid stabilization system protein ParE